MSTIDRQRIEAVKAIEALGYSFDGVEWRARVYGTPLPILQDEAVNRHRSVDRDLECTPAGGQVRV